MSNTGGNISSSLWNVRNVKYRGEYISSSLCNVRNVKYRGEYIFFFMKCKKCQNRNVTFILFKILNKINVDITGMLTSQQNVVNSNKNLSSWIKCCHLVQKVAILKKILSFWTKCYYFVQIVHNFEQNIHDFEENVILLYKIFIILN